MSEDNILTPNGWIRGRLVHEQRQSSNAATLASNGVNY